MRRWICLLASVMASVMWVSTALASEQGATPDPQAVEISEQQSALIEALELERLLVIMRVEGLAYGQELGADLFASGRNALWDAQIGQIYDTDRMAQVVYPAFTQSFGQTDLSALLAFFHSDLGRKIVALELDAREAMIDPQVEDLARKRFEDLGAGDDPRMQLITRFIEANDMLEANVSGALNASFQFYRGMVDGGGLEMSEADILRDVWSQEEETRMDSRAWLYGYLLLAYEPLSDDELKQYVDMSETPTGQILNTALFAAFNQMYNEISYALGLATGQQMKSQDL
ncbi:MAG: DUF2059 domain-containing protein [Pelagimonas sp.]|jgi:hypothetical protein|nr:DUF2059 domain-containing protein [Pelagimonas sp.]